MASKQPTETNSAQAETAGKATRIPKAFKSLSVAAFRTLELGTIFNVASMQMAIVARSWLAYDLSGSALVLGIVAVVRGLPQLVLSPVAGVAADRFDNRKILVISQSALCFLSLVNAVLVNMGIIQVWHLIVIGALQGVVFPFTMPTRQALIPQLVKGENLPNALAVDSAGRNLNRVMAPSLAGVLIAWNPTVAFYSIAVLSFLAAVTLLGLPSTRPVVDRSRNAMQQMVFGFRYMVTRRRLLILMAMAFLGAILGMPFQQMLPVFQAAVLKVGPEQLGFMYTAVGAGALVGSFAMAFRSDDPRRQLYQLITGVGFGAALIPFALSRNLGFSLAMLAIVGFCSEVYMTINRMIVLMNTDSGLYGRVMGVYSMAGSLMPVATLPMGALVDTFGAPMSVASSGLLLAISVLALSFILPRIWHKDPTGRPAT